MAIDKAALLERRIGEGNHEIEGFGAVRIRGLSVAEVRRIQALDDESARERRMVSYALLEPTLTDDEVGIWQENSAPGEINELVEAIVNLSGLGVGASKSGVSGV